MYKLTFYVPASHLEQVKSALFEKGAGRFRNYDHCCWQVLGEGQFRPLKGSRPFLGETGMMKTTPEYKVEMICTEHLIKAALQTLLSTHPYEEPAYEIYKILTAEELL